MEGDDGRPRVIRGRAPADGGLVTVVVEYPHATDRCTLYPAGLTATERLTCWLSVDRASVESLEAWR